MFDIFSEVCLVDTNEMKSNTQKKKEGFGGGGIHQLLELHTISHVVAFQEVEGLIMNLLTKRSELSVDPES